MDAIQIAGYTFDSDLAGIWGVKLLIIAIILVITWALAKAAKWSFAKLVDQIPLLQRAGGGDESIGTSLGRIVSLFIWLFGLIAVLQQLGFESVIQPIQGLLENIIAYIPNFVGAAVILFVGTAVAKIVKEIVDTTLSTIKFDKWANKSGITQVTGNSKISSTLSTIIFVMIIIPIAIVALDVLKVPAITDPAKSMLQMILHAVPLIIGASLLLGLGYVIARWVSDLLTTLLPDLGADRAINELGIIPKNSSASGVIATIVSIAIMIFFAIAATNMLGFPQLTNILQTVLEQAGSVAFGAVLIAFGVIIARILANLIESATGEGVAPDAAYFLTIGLFIFIGLKQMAIGGMIVDYAFLALAVGASLAFAIAFGIGGRDAAARMLDTMSRKSAPTKAMAAMSADMVKRSVSSAGKQAARKTPLKPAVKKASAKAVSRKAPANRK